MLYCVAIAKVGKKVSSGFRKLGSDLRFILEWEDDLESLGKHLDEFFPGRHTVIGKIGNCLPIARVGGSFSYDYNLGGLEN